MQVIVPELDLRATAEPLYLKISEAGDRPPLSLERMLWVYFLQRWFNLAVEEALYDCASMRIFASIDLEVDIAPRAQVLTYQRHRWPKRIDKSVKATNHRKSSMRVKILGSSTMK
jgi:IS5 family transposase